MAHQNGSQHALRETITALSAATQHHSQATVSISNTVSNSRETIYNTQFWTAAGSPLSLQPQPDFAHPASPGSGSVDCGQMYRANQQMCSRKINAQQVYAPLMGANGECASGDRAVDAMHYSSPLASPETISAHILTQKCQQKAHRQRQDLLRIFSTSFSQNGRRQHTQDFVGTSRVALSTGPTAGARSSGCNGKLQNAHDSDDWQSSVVAGVSCLYSVLRLCSSSRGPSKSGSPAMMLGPDVEAKTRLRIAQALGQWCSESSGNQEQGEEDNEEEAQLVRAIMVVPKADAYVDTRYAIIATHCRLFLRRGEHRWAEQKLKSAAVDAQQRSLYHWVHYFALELAHLYVASNNVRSALEVLQQSLKQAQQGSDRASEAVVGVQLLGLLIQERSWADAFALAKDLAAPMFDSALVALPQVRARFWSLQAAGSAMLGHHQGAQEACDSARQCLKEWQALFAKALTKKCVSDGGSSFVISGTRYGSVLRVRGWSYYEAHAWVMLVSAHATRGDNAHEKRPGSCASRWRALSGERPTGLATN
ncbi:hypothetical protein BX661DRAFT_32524 [Kickxella alabastrina]|uniref:uncharacterized protein n=1 Tax=Kickxella alabastrina TaxID=61397 RepID=UPI002220FA5C|nr:uncharacterized protein BX661DRAFT_32524 [Kickxella alabastrina]KAI7826326.1 hypothetical protein BX661DRAFT_32524 [Kickxella alabastrina]